VKFSSEFLAVPGLIGREAEKSSSGGEAWEVFVYFV